MSWELDPKEGLGAQILALFTSTAWLQGYVSQSGLSLLTSSPHKVVELVTSFCTFAIKFWISNIKKLPA